MMPLVLPEMPEAFSVKTRKIINECSESGEPIFVFRAKDLLSILILDQYAGLVEKFSPASQMLELITDDLNDFRKWQQSNPDRVRLPD